MTKEKHGIKAELRTVLGRKVKQLRKDGLTPATVYGHKFEPISVQFKTAELERLFDEVGESGLVELMVGEQKLPILFRNPQYGAIYGELLHVDAYKVNLKEKITASIPIEFVGESQAVKEGNVLVEVTNEVEVEALPTELPEKFEVDISVLENLESVITVADLKIDSSKVTMITPIDQVVVKVEEPRVEEEVVVETNPEEVEVINQKGEEEGGEEKKEEEKKEE